MNFEMNKKLILGSFIFFYSTKNDTNSEHKIVAF